MEGAFETWRRHNRPCITFWLLQNNNNSALRTRFFHQFQYFSPLECTESIVPIHLIESSSYTHV